MQFRGEITAGLLSINTGDRHANMIVSGVGSDGFCSQYSKQEKKKKKGAATFILNLRTKFWMQDFVHPKLLLKELKWLRCCMKP